ncbi:hypothetical protein FA13DRAFT_331354 [Coprinellus micaceus]|uniref:F-box domain-containing protein n=1 Tax=Coprinellus micaceus TaxID=71717 RepID=A0A4Y7TBF7_COPMI|nr:hypothetical protein FA13DRAFT_374076 [Coprinellus micaceus]TEB31507.1 hypothetical protein FA13DRAFT_331354 [Coprinellus micaceus]
MHCPFGRPLMLQRSKGAPLTVAHSCRRNEGQDVTDAVIQALSQTGRLRIVDTDLSNGLEGSLKAILSAPIIENICLSKHSLIASPLPVDFLHEGAPMLRRLNMLGFHPNWAAFPFGPTLVEVRLFQHEEHDYPSPGYFLRALDHMPNLQSLELSAKAHGWWRVVTHFRHLSSSTGAKTL